MFVKAHELALNSYLCLLQEHHPNSNFRFPTAIKFSTYPGKLQLLYDEIIKKSSVAINGLGYAEIQKTDILNRLMKLKKDFLNDLVEQDVHLYFSAFLNENYVSMINPFFRTATQDGNITECIRDYKQTFQVLKNCQNFLACFYKIAYLVVVENGYFDPNDASHSFNMIKRHKPDIKYFRDVVKTHLYQACLSSSFICFEKFLTVYLNVDEGC